MFKKFITVASSLALSAMCLTGCNQTTTDKEAKKTLDKVTIAEVTHSVFYAPQYAAVTKGFFEEEGIEVDIINTSGADKTMAALISGEAQVGLMGPEASIYVYNQGNENYAVNFAQLTKTDGSFIVAREEMPNFTLEDLKGKDILGGRKGGVPLMTLEYVLKKNGINPQTDLILDDSIKFDLMAGAFSSGDAEYVTLFEPTASLTEKEGKGYIVASVGAEAGEIPYTAYFAKKSYIENNEDTIQKFTNAIYKGEQFVKEHTSTEIAESIQSFFPDTDIEQLANAVQSYKDIDAWNDTPILKEEAYNRLEEVMTMAGELQEKAPYEKVINNKYAEESIK